MVVDGIASGPAVIPPTLGDAMSIGAPSPGGIDRTMTSPAARPPSAVAHADQSRVLEGARVVRIAAASADWACSICAMRARTAAARFAGGAGCGSAARSVVSAVAASQRGPARGALARMLPGGVEVRARIVREGTRIDEPEDVSAGHVDVSS